MIVPSKRKHLAFNRLQDQIIIIDFNSDRQFHQVNELGARIWELCDGKNTELDIANTLFEEFDVERSTLEKDLTSFLSELKNNELLDY
jgi:hypothetical protein